MPLRGLNGGNGNNVVILRPISPPSAVEQLGEIIQVVELSKHEVEKLNAVSA